MLSKTKLSVLITLVSATTILSACGGSDAPKPVAVIPTETIEPPTRPDYQALLDAAVSPEVTGMTLIIESDEEYFLGSAGVASKETLEPMGPDAVMPTGSAGKSMIAALALILQEEGLLNLDDTLDVWLPEDIIGRLENAARITVRQLLNHTAGVYEYLDNDAFIKDLAADPDALRLDNDLLKYFLDQPATFQPGEGFSYSNSGYVLAGLVLDSVLGEHHSNALRERILMPLGMDNTFYLGAENYKGDIISGYRALNDFGISDDPTLTDLKPYLYNLGVGDAPVASNVEDYMAFQQGLIDGDGLFTYESAMQMYGDESMISLPGSSAYIPGSTMSYGLGMLKEYTEDKTLYHHGGDQFGWLTHNVFWQEKHMSIILMTNCASQACNDASESVIREILEIN